MRAGFESKQEYEERARKANFWMRLGRRAMLAFGALFGLTLLLLAIVKLLTIFGKSVPVGLFGNIIFGMAGLLIVTSLVILASNFLRNLYRRGSPCDSCNTLQCSECEFQKPVRLER